MNNIVWDFRGKNVLVVGGSRGIGKGVVDGFTASGANVVELNSSVCDIKYKEEIDTFIDSIYEVDILINVAAVNYAKKIGDITFGEWDEVLNTNLRGYFYSHFTTELVTFQMFMKFTK